MTLNESWSSWMDLREGLDGRLSWYTTQYIEVVRLRRIHVNMTLAGATSGLILTLAAFTIRPSRVLHMRR
jgi:hypothetical protein